MRIACLLLIPWQLAAADWLPEVKQRGAALEKELHWADAAGVYQSALARLGAEGLPAEALPAEAARNDRFWLLTSLVEISFERQEYTMARGWLRQAEDTLRGLGQDAPERVRLLNAWGTLHLVEGNLTAAERELSRAVEMSESMAAPTDLAAALHNLAAVEMHTGRLRDATAHEMKALAIWRRQFGDRHYYVMKALISLSSLQGLSGDWRAAEASLQNALEIAETPEALANYAVVLEKLKRRKEAREIRRRIHLPMPAPPPLADVKAMPSERERTQVRTR
jgi:tetratricopeptide (TPR) repeat protein